MSDKKIISVVGATGAQGGGLVHAISSLLPLTCNSSGSISLRRSVRLRRENCPVWEGPVYVANEPGYLNLTMLFGRISCLPRLFDGLH